MSTAASNKLIRMQASKGRHDLLLHKIRLERVTGVLKKTKDPFLYEVEQKMISDGHLDPIMLTPQKKDLAPHAERW